jgi:thioredoxin 1
MICISPLQSQTKKQSQPKKNFTAPAIKQSPQKKNVEVSAAKPLITFYELGSVNCIPCRKMQPIMKSIEEKYG